jgi:rhomboid family GlyGly-CTERM serine protease
VQSNALFPLTPALSLGEREYPSQSIEVYGRPDIGDERANVLPLPKGEGRGEGEGDLRTPSASRHCAVQRPYPGPRAISVMKSTHPSATCHLPSAIRLSSQKSGIRPELFLFLALLALFNLPFPAGSWLHSMIFLPGAVQAGEWWRLFTHPFVHVTWYHLLLDGTAFLALYHSLRETSFVRRLLYAVGAGLGSVLVAWAVAPGISTSGLCGLSGAAHGLMAVSSLELISAHPRGSTERRIGQIGFILVVGKAALEALSGHMFFTFLHFGLMGIPVAASHAGGILGGLLVMLGMTRVCSTKTRASPSP